MVEAKKIKIENTTSAIPSNLETKFKKLGQDHVFKFIDQVGESEKSTFLEQLSKFDLQKVLTDFEDARKRLEDKSTLQPQPIKDTDIIKGDNEKFKEIGLKAIKDGKVAVITLAGGQGTRLGSSAPKGCYNIGLPSKMSLFELQAMRIKKLAEMASDNSTDGATIPWYIMTSNVTHKETEAFYKANNYFGLSPENVKFFKQGELPAISKEGKLLLQTQSSLAMSPNGNGGIYSALRNEGVLEDMKKREIKFVHMFCVDNALVRVADPVFIGACVERGTDCGTKTISKEDPLESVGIVCRGKDNGKMMVAEYSELDPELATKKNSNGNLLFNQANIANHFFTVPFLEKIANASLPIHLAYKTIPSIDQDGNQLKTPNMGYKLEAFIFDVFQFAEKPMIFEGDRLEEFAPLKNAPGTEKDSPEYCRQMLINLHKDWLIKSGVKVTGDVEISPMLSYAGEGLGSEMFKGKDAVSGFLSVNKK